MKTKKRIKQEKLSTPDVKKLLRIMKRHNLIQADVAKILKLHFSTVCGWFYASKNATGNINKMYFEKLKKKGYV